MHSDNNLPVVALESTIISHGFNYPENIESARRCEEKLLEKMVQFLQLLELLMEKSQLV